MTAAEPAPTETRNFTGSMRKWLLAGMAAGGLAGLLLVGGTVAARDPLLFFRRSAHATQPFFYLKREGNFSRYVYTGLMRNLSYEMLWVGPSYVAPFARGADPQRELVVSMGNMSGWELLAILRLESRQQKARTINVIISPLHFTDAFAPGGDKTGTFPDGLWERGGTLRYLADPYMVRVAAANPGNGQPAIDLHSDAVRRRINEAYFWMHDDPVALRNYWTEYQARRITTDSFIRLRENLARAAEAAPVRLTDAEEILLRNFFREIAELRRRATVNFIFPPRHLASFGTEFESFQRGVEIKRRFTLFAQSSGTPLFDFEADPEFALDRTRHYDMAHFTERGVDRLRAEVLSGRPKERSLDALFERFRRTTEADDRAALAGLPE